LIAYGGGKISRRFKERLFSTPNKFSFKKNPKTINQAEEVNFPFVALASFARNSFRACEMTSANYTALPNL